jgi:hypothetical protein
MDLSAQFAVHHVSMRPPTRRSESSPSVPSPKTRPARRFLRIFGFALVAGVALGADSGLQVGVIQGFTLLFQNAAGQDNRRLKAETLVDALTDTPKLHNGTVEFFQPPNPQRVAILDFVDAVLHKTAQQIDGDGPVHLTSVQANLAGRGFLYDHPSGHLQLRSEVAIDVGTTHVTGTRGEAIFSKTSTGPDQLVEGATISGGVVLTGYKSSDPMLQFDRAETDNAVYSAIGDQITLAPPVHFFKNGVQIAEGATAATPIVLINVHSKKPPPPPAAPNPSAPAPAQSPAH